MEKIISALADSARWRILELLAERPRSVGELAELTGLRQPQTTKHLQTLGNAGLVTVFPLGQRRVYAIEAAPLTEVGQRLRLLIEAAEKNRGERDVVARYQAAIEADAAKADRDRWADGRSFLFERALPASRDLVWRHFTDATLLASWWVPPSLAISECVLEPRPGGRAVLEYRDAEGRYRSEGRVHAAEEPERLVFDLSVLDGAGGVSFTGHYDVSLTETEGGTALRLGLQITETTAGALPYIAGIETGWRQVLDNLTHAVEAAMGSNAATGHNKEEKDHG
ncbi:metalloregulator ArsR/SmtB family transcription factor [Ensifer adhaerens]|uniref:metalloregulator ArsR/SmtB family transcription factor n=1 Tax=Ensifer adhaerens TaxID=106592 RepID=UPI00098E8806|nr:metalloregulator ArsR/SmtB family transcription factor [Ensifer adhaerens]